MGELKDREDVTVEIKVRVNELALLEMKVRVLRKVVYLCALPKISIYTSNWIYNEDAFQQYLTQHLRI